ncbi:ABC transporter ATP-binding protein [Pseudonocardia pini]|uniref:ABC transporter ATP-binding protein n=1 Tax=Pseudonocardia pini TaxID=2758030 RepID=UPI0015F02097|nr:ABC transporter ATP-binding protein [Pseudonocardia pini]
MAAPARPLSPVLRTAGVGHDHARRRGAATRALVDVDLEVAEGEFVAVVGRSGCGKSTLLRILAGLVRPTRGRIEVDGTDPWRAGSRDPAAFAPVGMVFQDPNLFPWYSVRDNVGLPLRLLGVGRAERRHRAEDLCRGLGLAGFETAMPRELSGGMRQRASIARALIRDPAILLMDEPFGALDALTRDTMTADLQDLHTRTRSTVVFVTHSIPEAVFLADRVVLLTPRPGRVAAVVDVSLPRPRTDTSAPEFQAVVRRVRAELEAADG